MKPAHDPWHDDDQYGWLLIGIVGIILAMLLSGCAYTLPVLESEKARRAKPDTVTFCEVRVGERKCWQVPREDVRTVIREMGL